MGFGGLRRLVRELERSAPTSGPADGERVRWDWYAEGCPCGAVAGECREHPRARGSQRPPAGEWRTWLLLMGRGAGKTRSAAEWVRSRAESDPTARLALVGATAADVRDTMVEGESGLLAISPPWFMPRYEPSKRRLTWPNGARATTFSADEPERLRGPQHSGAWCDEVASWRYPAAMENLLLGLRLGDDPRLCVTTTPKPVPLIRELVTDPSTAIARGTTYDNRAHLAGSFFDRITTKFEGTRLGHQELSGELLEVADGVWFSGFDPARHISEEAEYLRGWPVHLAIDFGASRHTGAVWFQVRGHGTPQSPRRVTVFGDFHAENLHSESAAWRIHDLGVHLPCCAEISTVRLDPYGVPSVGMGQTAYAEFEKVFGPSVVSRWPMHRVVDGLDQLEVLLDKGLLLIHPRCLKLKAAFLGYCRRRSARGDWLDEPLDPQHPHEDVMDALRGGVRDRFPEGRIERPGLRSFDLLTGRRGEWKG